MTGNKNNIPRDAYTKPLVIDTRQTRLTVRFEPRENTNKDLRSPSYSRTVVIDSTQGEIAFFRFEMNDAKRKSAPVKILLDYDTLVSIIHLLDSEESNQWASTAAEVRYYNEIHQLEEKYSADCHEVNGLLIYTNPSYYQECREVENRRDTQQGILDSEEPLKLRHYTIDNWENSTPNTSTAGATMTIFYQPKVNGKNAAKPWIIEIAQYELQYNEDDTNTRKRERSKSVKLTSQQINTLINKLVADLGLWAGQERVVNSYVRNPKKFSDRFR